MAELLGDWAAGHGPLYRKLGAAIGNSITAGELPAGLRLPSERDLAKLLLVSRATVVAAYDELRGGGLLDSVRGSGTRVSAAVRPQLAGADGQVPGGRATSIFQRLVDGPGQVISLARAAEPAAPQLRDAFLDLGRDDLSDLMADAGYHPRGLPVLREAICDHFVAQLLPTTASQVLVTNGAQQVLGLVARMYLTPGCTVVVESPSWPGCLDVFRDAGARLVSVPLDEDGIRPDALAKAFAEHNPVLAYLMPTYHNPTGALLSANRRKRVAELAAQYRVPVLEDNAYAGFPTLSGAQAPPPIAAFAQTHDDAQILSVGSLAKSVWAGLRIGWVRGPSAVIERLARYKARADLGNAVLDQALAARLLPKLTDITAARREVLLRRLHQLQDLLATHLPDWRWRSPEGGSALWVELPDTDAQVFAQVALRHGVEVVPGSATDPSGGHDNHIRLPFTLPDADELVRRLAEAWADLRG
ncbi:PLP-dependent aminotransferase family protein [Kibdelosporangium phytohabitans]|uniref:aminotransferase-like domain-containing protein n=1 Tax=Kibdelosporangium phytohabitans TaxID=860235 RepID=UPI0019FA837A|nr:PLP-dependent aminotransferase family protein [Kibdelosporangium phytohabitans]MBE1469509.1 DNA-binding transcriptional MocR family regulator [Kibdelosporangium phytohabitans]